MGPTYLLGDAGASDGINLQSCRFNHANSNLENQGHLPSHRIWNSCVSKKNSQKNRCLLVYLYGVGTSSKIQAAQNICAPSNPSVCVEIRVAIVRIFCSTCQIA